MGGNGIQCIGLTTLPPLLADCLDILEPYAPVQACTRIAKTEVCTVLMKILVVWSVDGLFNRSEDGDSDMEYLGRPGCQYK